MNAITVEIAQPALENILLIVFDYCAFGYYQH